MMLSAIFAVGYLVQLLAKVGLALRFAQTSRLAASGVSDATVTVLQPILGGDPALSATLEANLRTLPGVRFLWLVDLDDPIGEEACVRALERFPHAAVEILRFPAPAQGINPKAIKLALALPRVSTELLVVLDDDTRISRAGLQALRNELHRGATLATGLPRYHAAEGEFSGWLAEFVNSSAVLSYLPALVFSAPVSIHGMCYALRTADARKWDVFTEILHRVTDDLALAQVVRSHGGRIAQTIEAQDIASSITPFRHLIGVLHRWFVFARLLFDECSLVQRMSIFASYVIPPLMLWALVILACFSKVSLILASVVFGLRALLIVFVKHSFLGPASGNRPFVSVLLELAQPLFLASAYVYPVIRWRLRTIKVSRGGKFAYQ